MNAPREMGDGIVICDTLEEVKELQKSKNIMKGITPKQKDQIEITQNDGEPNTLKIPASMFSDFAEIGAENEAMFEYLALTVLLNFLRKCCLKHDQGLTEHDRQRRVNWETALEFPDVIASQGRVMLHEMADYFSLAHHSVGKKGKSRRTVVYPKTLFQEKQRTEVNKLLREREKVRSNYCKNMQFDGEVPKKNSTFLEKVLLEFWYEKNNVTPPSREITEYMPKLEDVGKAPDLGRLQDCIELKLAHLSRLEDNHQKLS